MRRRKTIPGRFIENLAHLEIVLKHDKSIYIQYHLRAKCLPSVVIKQMTLDTIIRYINRKMLRESQINFEGGLK